MTPVVTASSSTTAALNLHQPRVWLSPYTLWFMPASLQPQREVCALSLGFIVLERGWVSCAGPWAGLDGTQAVWVWSLTADPRVLTYAFGEGNGNPLQFSCLENPMDRGTWWATVHGVTQSRTRLKWLSMHALIHLSHQPQGCIKNVDVIFHAIEKYQNLVFSNT